MHFDEIHNHKWARQLGHARSLLERNLLAEWYRGELRGSADVYPGMRILAAHWIATEYRMRVYLQMLLRGSGHPEWESDPAILEPARAHLARFLDDMRALVARERIVAPERIDDLLAAGLDTPPDWALHVRAMQTHAEAAVACGRVPDSLAQRWFDTCLRAVANANRLAILAAVSAAALLKREGAAALRAAVDATAEECMWALMRAFYVDVMPAAGFVEAGDMVELGLQGLYSDQDYHLGPERQEDAALIRDSIFDTCQLAGIYRHVEGWNALEPHSLGYACCRYCEAQLQGLLMVALPHMLVPSTRRLQSLAMQGLPCAFERSVKPGEDRARLQLVQEKVFTRPA